VTDGLIDLCKDYLKLYVLDASHAVRDQKLCGHAASALHALEQYSAGRWTDPILSAIADISNLEPPELAGILLNKAKQRKNKRV